MGYGVLEGEREEIKMKKEKEDGSERKMKVKKQKETWIETDEKR